MLITATDELPVGITRIVSLVPSITALLHALDLDAETIGITRFCIHPPQWQEQKTCIGGTKDVKVETIRQLQPDLIIANLEENEREPIEQLSQQFPVWVTHIKTLEDALHLIEQLGRITGRTLQSETLINKIVGEFENLPAIRSTRKAAYLIWRKPYMAAGGDTYIHDLFTRAGLINIFSEQLRYPVTDTAELQKFGCEVVLLSSEPFPFSQKHQLELEAALPGTQVILVPGEPFSWYGSHLLQAPAAIVQLMQNTGTCEPVFPPNSH